MTEDLFFVWIAIVLHTGLSFVIWHDIEKQIKRNGWKTRSVLRRLNELEGPSEVRLEVVEDE